MSDADIYHAALARLTQRSDALVYAIKRACRELRAADPEVHLIFRDLQLALVKFNEGGDS